MVVVLISGAFTSLLLDVVVARPASATGSGPFAYVPNVSSNNVTVIDTSTNSVVATVPVGSAPTDVAITPDGRYAYVVNDGSAFLSVIDTATNSVVASPSCACASASSIAITPDGHDAYVSNFSSVQVIDTTTNSVVHTISPVIAGWAHDAGPKTIAISPDGLKAYVTGYNGTSGYFLTVIDTTTNTVVGSPISLTTCEGTDWASVQFSPDGNFAYVGGFEQIGSTTDGTVCVFNATSNTLTATINLGANLETNEIAITPDGHYLYGNHGSVVDITTNTVVGSTGAVGLGLAVTPDGKHAYIASVQPSLKVGVIDTSTNTLVGSPIAAGTNPWAVAITPDQAPVAALTVTPAAAGLSTAFDASASTAPSSPIVSYAWDFGDGHTATTTSPTTTHVYATAGPYTATVTETDQAGTSTTQAFTGQTMSRNGGPQAKAFPDVHRAGRGCHGHHAGHLFVR